MTLQGKHGIIGTHPQAIVYHTDKVFPAVLHHNNYLTGTCIKGVFHQLFYHRSRAFNYLARGDFVADVFGQDVDSFHLASNIGKCCH